MVESHWQVKCYQWHFAVSITLKSKIRYNGQEYSSPSELPPEVRTAYENALHEGHVTKKFVVNGQAFNSEEAMPGDIRKLCDDAMDVIANNGEVTLPDSQKPDPLLSKREIGVAIAVGAGIAALVLARVFHG